MPTEIIMRFFYLDFAASSIGARTTNKQIPVGLRFRLLSASKTYIYGDASKQEGRPKKHVTSAKHTTPGVMKPGTIIIKLGY